MKKLLTFILALVMVMSLSVTAFAEGEQSGTTTLTAEIPNAAAPSYTIQIPANTTLEYGNTDKQFIGRVSVKDVTNVETDGLVAFTSPYTDLINTEDPGDTIALVLYGKVGDPFDLIDKTTGLWYGASPGVYAAKYDQYYSYQMWAEVTDWSGATPGATYQAVITFQFKVVY